MSLKATQHQFFRPTPKTSMLGLLMIVIPYIGLTYTIKKERVCINRKYKITIIILILFILGPS